MQLDVGVFSYECKKIIRPTENCNVSLFSKSYVFNNFLRIAKS